MALNASKTINGDDFKVISYGKTYFANTVTYGIFKNGTTVGQNSLDKEVKEWIDSIVVMWTMTT